jgi:hypothetical protein
MIVTILVPDALAGTVCSRHPSATPGGIVPATGTLALDRDFGAGYRYGVIVEGAAAHWK